MRYCTGWTRCTRKRPYVALFMAHVLLGLVFHLALDRTDPERDWAPVAQEQLQAGDAFLTRLAGPGIPGGSFAYEHTTCLVSDRGSLVHARPFLGAGPLST